MSRCLTDRSIDHVVLERGVVANSWKTERWDSLRLLTPNWQSRLPGYGYEGNDPDGYRTMPETIAFIERYAEVILASWASTSGRPVSIGVGISSGGWTPPGCWTIATTRSTTSSVLGTFHRCNSRARPSVGRSISTRSPA